MSSLSLALVLAVVIGVGLRKVRAKGRRWSVGRTAALGGGVVALAVSAVPDTTRFSGHMTEHVLVGMVAPLLLALGAPATLALQAVSPEVRTRVLRLLHGRVVGALTHPLVAWALFAATPVAIYFTPLLRLSISNDLVHAAVHVHLLVAGFAFFWPAVAVDPAPRALPHGGRVLYLLLAVPFHAFLGVALLSASEPLGGADATWTVADQRNGAGILWASGDLLALVAGGFAMARWMAADDRAAARQDRLSGG